MAEKVKARESMPPPTATLEEIGEFWDTHSLADYWDETHEVAFEVVNLKSKPNLVGEPLAPGKIRGGNDKSIEDNLIEGV